MKLLLDEMLDQRLTRHIEGHECVPAKAAGLKGLSNGDLLHAAEVLGFHALITIDQNIQYQTNLTGKKISIVIICVFKNKISQVLLHLPELLRALESLKPGDIRYIGEPRLVRKHTQS